MAVSQTREVLPIGFNDKDPQADAQCLSSTLQPDDAKAVAITSLADFDLDQGHLKASSRHVSGSRVQCRACLFAAVQIALHGKLRRHVNGVPSLVPSLSHAFSNIELRMVSIGSSSLPWQIASCESRSEASYRAYAVRLSILLASR